MTRAYSDDVLPVSWVCMGALHRVPSQACSAVVVHSILDCLASRTCPLFQCNAGVFVPLSGCHRLVSWVVMTLGRLIQFRLEGIHLGYFVAVLGVRAYSCLGSDAQNQTCHQHKRQESQGCGQIGKTQSQTDCQSRTRNWARTEPKQGKIFSIWECLGPLQTKPKRAGIQAVFAFTPAQYLERHSSRFWNFGFL